MCENEFSNKDFRIEIEMLVLVFQKKYQNVIKQQYVICDCIIKIDNKIEKVT